MKKIINILVNEKTFSMFLLAGGIALAGFSLGDSILKSKLLERQVSVKGLAEREVMSDYSTWTITDNVTGGDLLACYSKVESNKNLIIDFLVQKGFNKDEISLGNYRVTDRLANSYREPGVTEEFRYTINFPITLRTSKVELVEKTSQSQSELTQKGIVFDNEGPYYAFTNFNDLKPEMLSEGIRNARVAAEKFASDSGSRVGQLKKANQGTFIIGPVDSVDAGSEYDNAYYAKKSLRKKIRVVTTLEYFLEN